MKYLLSLILLLSLGITQAQTQSFGEEFEVIELQPVAVIISSPDEYLDQPATISGELTAVCQNAGCWARIGESSDAEESLFVKFGDHDFTIPLDMEGRVVVHGTLLKKETSVEEQRHLAQDAGKSAEEIEDITEPQVEYWFMADGLQSM